MSLRLTVRVAAPSIAISFVLLALGTVGGWYVNRLQKSTADALVRATDTSPTIRAWPSNFFFGMNSVRSELTEYLVTGNRSHLDSVSKEDASQPEQSLAETERLAADDPKEEGFGEEHPRRLILPSPPQEDTEGRGR